LPYMGLSWSLYNDLDQCYGLKEFHDYPYAT